MKRRGVRLALVVTFLVVLAATGVTLFRAGERAAAVRTATRDFDLASQRILSSLADARGSLQAALVPGQGPEYWLPRALAALESARTGIAALKQRASDGEVLNDLDAAAATVEQLSATRGELARMLRNDLRTQAGNLLFGEGLDAAATAAERVEGARLGEIARADAAWAASRAYEILGAGVALALGLVVIGLLLPSGQSEAEVDLAETRDAVTPSASSADDAVEPTGAEQPEPVPSAPQPAIVAAVDAVPPAAQETVTGSAPIVKDRRKAPELRAAADLCTDFARLVDARELPALLDRAATLLDANGFIVWLAEPGGQTLRPTLAHGYPPQALSRLPAIGRNADNATAAAYRHAEMQVVHTNGMSPGAVVVPLLGPSGCVGAVAAEVRHGREASESLRALARIVAAQISTLVAADTAAAAPENQQAAI
jgi:hypothetical protein